MAFTFDYSRADIGLRKARSVTRLNWSKVRYCDVHWPGSKMAAIGTDVAKIKRLIKGWQDYHMDGHGWSDISYNIAVDQAGRTYELRGFDRVGGGAKGYGAVSCSILAILAVGEKPTDAMKLGIRKVQAEVRRRGGSDVKLTWHHALLSYTECPGPDLIAWGKAGFPAPSDPPELGDRLLSKDGFDRGPDVAQLAALLKEQGYDTGLPADEFGPLMDAALRDFQTKRGLLVTGRTDPDTLVALRTREELPVPDPQPAPVPVPAVFRFGQANLRAERFGGLDDASPKRGEFLRSKIAASVYALCEVPEAARYAIRKAMGGPARWGSYAEGYVAAMWDTSKWERVGQKTVPFGTAGVHGAVRVNLVHKATGIPVDVVSVHVRPGDAFPDDADPEQVRQWKLGDVGEALDLVRDGVFTVLAGDFNLGDADVPILKAGFLRATPDVDTVDKKGDQRLDAVFVLDLTASSPVLVDPGSVSDHMAWRVTLKAQPNG